MLNGVKAKGVIDSGAEQTVVSELMTREAKLKVQPSDRLIKGISGGPSVLLTICLKCCYPVLTSACWRLYGDLA